MNSDEEARPIEEFFKSDEFSPLDETTTLTVTPESLLDVRDTPSLTIPSSAFIKLLPELSAQVKRGMKISQKEERQVTYYKNLMSLPVMYTALFCPGNLSLPAISSFLMAFFHN